MTAYWVVLAAVALTTVVAAVVGATLAAFAGQALPQAVRHELTTAGGTSISATAPVSGGAAAAQATATLKTALGAALPGIPFAFWQASWSDPLGFAPGALRSRPASAPAGSTLLLTATAMQDIKARATLVAGQWPTAPGPAGAGQPIPAALPATAAALLHLSVGDVVRLSDRVSNTPVTFRITGLVARPQLPVATAYWLLDPVPASGSASVGGFTTFGPLLVDPAAFGAALPVSSATWAAQPDMAAFTDTDLGQVAADVSALQSSVASSAESSGAQLTGVQLTTGLAGVLSGTAENLTVARSLLAISAVQLLVLAVAALLAIARLLAAQRASETELLTARGATRWQLTRLTATEVIPLSCVAALVGAFAGIRLAQVLAGTLYRGGTGTGGISAGAAGTWLDALGATVAVAVIAGAVLLYPVLRPAPGAGGGGGARGRRGRQAVLASATRAGADLGLIALAVLAGWQLRLYSAVSPGGGGSTPGIDPVLVLAPALALAGGTVVMLRLLPAAARGGDRLAARGRKLTAPLASWQFSRQPLRQGGAALLLVMAVATGTLALAQHRSWTQSAADQAAQATGADVRADLPGPLAPGAVGTLTQAQGVQHAMAAYVSPQALPAEVLAIDATQAPRTVLLRGDQSPLPASRLFATIAPAGQAGGTQLSGRPDSVRLTASLNAQGRAGTVTGLGAVTVLVTITDSAGAGYQIPLGTLPADGRPHVLTAPLGGTRVSYPLRLTQVSFGYTLAATRAAATPLTLTVSGAPLAGWTAGAASPELDQAMAVGGQGTAGPAADPGTVTWHPSADRATLAFTPGYGRAAPGANAPPGTAPLPLTGQVTLTAGGMAPAAIPAIATTAFLRANNTAVGATLPATINGVTVPVRIAAETTTFPTVAGGALIVDLRTLQGDLASHGGYPLPVTEWWLATADGAVPPGLARALPPGSAVSSTAALAAAVTGDPLAAAPQQALLALAIAAALLAITGFWVSIAADVRQRRAENALLAALGVGRRSAAAQLFLEKLLLSVPSAVLGLVLGLAVARLLVPAVTLTTSARQPVPPPVTLFDLPQTLPLAAVVAIVPALAAALVVVRRPDPAAELRAAEAT